MLTDEELAALPNDPVQAFVYYEACCRQRLQENKNPHNWEAERKYIASMLAFIHEFDLEVKVNDIAPGDDLYTEYFSTFIDQIDYYIGRFRLRSASISKRKFETILYLTDDYRLEIHRHIAQIRKIVPHVDMTERQREVVYSHLAALSEEVSRNRTRIESLTSLWLYTTNAAAEGVENLEPVFKAIERLAKVFGRVQSANDEGRIPPPPERHRLPKPEPKPSIELDDEIPF